MKCNSFVNDSISSTGEGMHMLGKCIKGNLSIENIYLDGSNISDRDVEILAPYLDGNSTIQHISLSYNHMITDVSIPYLLKIIESSHIADLDLTGTLITSKSLLNISIATNVMKYELKKLELIKK